MIFSPKLNDFLAIIEENKDGKFLSEIQISFNQYEDYSKVDISINKCLGEELVTTLSVKTNYYDFIDKIERIFNIDNH